MRAWHVLEKKRRGERAAAAYRGPTLQGLLRTWPGKRICHTLEGNGPTGFKARAGVGAKKEVGIKAFEIPKRSPDLNVCDYALQAAVNRKTRRQERRLEARAGGHRGGRRGWARRGEGDPRGSPSCPEEFYSPTIAQL